MINVFRAIFGTKNSRDLKRLRPYVDRINEIEKSYQSLSDEELKAKTPEFRARVAALLAKNVPVNDALDTVMCEAFATVKNCCRRLMGTKKVVCGHEQVWDMIPFDVQLLGGIVLHQGKIAEMQTGEGKTLVATLPLYLNALSGKNVQLVTVNDYLARRDAQWMGTIYEWLGLTVGCIQNHMSPSERRAQYACDITYGTNSEFGFDYLRDNGMAQEPEQVVQNGHFFAIVDEVDSILIDEARTPLIISGPAQQNSMSQYKELKPLVENLVSRQLKVCNRMVTEAKEAIEKGDRDTAMCRLYQIYHGMPKHKQFLHLLENVEVRKMHEQVENQMLTEMRKAQARELVEKLYFTIDERTRECSLTDNGCDCLCPSDPNMFVMPDLVTALSKLDGDTTIGEEERAQKRQQIQSDFMLRSERVHNVEQLLRAYCLYERDQEYVVQDNHVYIVDEFTGRILPGRRWSDGLHQAVEAKEGVEIERETQTLATITIQNYFRLYDKLAGMTGTAETEATEFHDIYKLDVVSIPTNRPVRRIDGNDLIYQTQREKYRAILEEVQKRHEKGQPILLGTVSVDTSEILSRMLRMAKIPHNVLNAKNHAREAEIIALAGQPGAVTIATNMAGRGTDIKLGEGVVWMPESDVKSQIKLEDKYEGNKTLAELLEERPCGLHVIGSERHESRRIDRQLRGRCSRQGDPGSSRFYISLEDNLMRLFGSDRISGIMKRLGMKEGEALEHKWLNRSVETAQRRVEQQNYSIRKKTLEYDDVMNRQRTVVYELRGEVLKSASAHEKILDVFNDIILTQCERYLCGEKDSQPEDLVNWIVTTFPIALTVEEVLPFRETPDKAGELIYQRVADAYELKCSMEEQEALPYLERIVFLRCIDQQWQDFLRAMDELRQGVNLRAYGHRDPLVEYKREAYGMFEVLMTNIKTEIATSAFRAQTVRNFMRQNASKMPSVVTVHNDVNILADMTQDPALAGQPVPPPEDIIPLDVPDAAIRSFDAKMKAMSDTPTPPSVRMAMIDGKQIGRNDPCPCGSGKKYKKCCGRGL